MKYTISAYLYGAETSATVFRTNDLETAICLANALAWLEDANYVTVHDTGGRKAVEIQISAEEKEHYS